jgi:hypothetical protein
MSIFIFAGPDNNVYRRIFERKYYPFVGIFHMNSIIVEFRKSSVSLQSIDPFDSCYSLFRYKQLTLPVHSSVAMSFSFSNRGPAE